MDTIIQPNIHSSQPLLSPIVSAQQLLEAIRHDSSIRLLDVRTPGEYGSVHIPGSYNVPLDNLGEHGAEIRSHTSSPVVLLCQSGSRARQAEEALKNSGMANVHVLEGGINAWIVANNPVKRGEARMSLERQVRIVAGSIAATGGILALAVNPLFAILPTFIGSGLVFAGITDTCGMAFCLMRLPYNRPSNSCDVPAMVRALKEGASPETLTRAGHPVPISQETCST